jgi:hypothetical protein
MIRGRNNLAHRWLGVVLFAAACTVALVCASTGRAAAAALIPSAESPTATDDSGAVTEQTADGPSAPADTFDSTTDPTPPTDTESTPAPTDPGSTTDQAQPTDPTSTDAPVTDPVPPTDQTSPTDTPVTDPVPPTDTPVTDPVPPTDQTSPTDTPVTDPVPPTDPAPPVDEPAPPPPPPTAVDPGPPIIQPGSPHDSTGVQEVSPDSPQIEVAIPVSDALVAILEGPRPAPAPLMNETADHSGPVTASEHSRGAPGEPRFPSGPTGPSSPGSMPSGGGGAPAGGFFFSGFAALVAAVCFGLASRTSRRLIPSVAEWQPVAVVSLPERPG